MSYPGYCQWTEQRDECGRRYFLGQRSHDKMWEVCRDSKNINDEQDTIYHSFVFKKRAEDFYDCLIQADIDIERAIKEKERSLENYNKAGMLQ